MNSADLSGIHVPLVTPFAADGTVATDSLEDLAHAVLDAGARGIVALGTTAEAASLTPDERRAVIEVCAHACLARDAMLIIGTGSNDTRGTAVALAELAELPELAGLANRVAALVPVPYFTRPTEAGVVAHFAALESAGPVPLVVYHVPHRTAQPLGAAALRTIGGFPHVIGVKYAAGGLDDQAVELLGDLPPDFAVLAGDDVVASPLLALGAAGAILASAHVATEHFIRLATTWRDGDADQARVLGHRLAALSSALFAEPNPAVVKAVLHRQGRIPTPDVRLPLLPAGRVALDRALDAIARTDAGSRSSQLVRSSMRS